MRIEDILNDPKFELVVSETFKDISLYESEEITDEIFLPYFEHNLEIFGYGEILVEFELTKGSDWGRFMKEPITFRNKNLIVGRDTNLTDAGKKSWEGIKTVSSWLANKVKEKWGSGQQNAAIPQNPVPNPAPRQQRQAANPPPRRQRQAANPAPQQQRRAANPAPQQQRRAANRQAAARQAAAAGIAANNFNPFAGNFD